MSQEKPPTQKKKSGWRVLLRIVLIVVFLILAFFGGAIAGFVVLGKQDLSHVWDFNTWRHVYDLVFAP